MRRRDCLASVGTAGRDCAEPVRLGERGGETAAISPPLAALRFERVNSFKARNIDPAARAAVLNLLAVDFDETPMRPPDM